MTIDIERPIEASRAKRLKARTNTTHERLDTSIMSAPALASGSDLPTALGWLYVAEGSNLGAAFLLKEAAKLGLSEAFGARHLAAAPEGRGLQWRTFTAALDALELSDDEEGRVVAGAEAAFRRVRGLVKDAFG